MLFNSYTFLLFFCCTFFLYRAFSNWTAQKWLLLTASYAFYAAWYAPYVAILVFSTTLDWWIARCIFFTEGTAKRKRLLIVSLVCNLGLLGFFKYGGFLLTNLQDVLAFAGIHPVLSKWDVVLPIGISFYTFASLSYTIDVYRREVKGDCGLLDYALFVSFFPHLVAGPIVRARLLLPQIQTPRHATVEQVAWGLCLTCFGLFAKVVLADSIFAPVVEQVYAQPDAYGRVDAWAAVLGFSGQIYFDFSGYSLCAIGLALCFGFEFPDNFRYPYAALSFSDFWRRWHISLSTWLRDYLYIPLGGNRQSERKTYRNLILTMLLGGIWHGASWMFVIWGGLHGVYLAVERWIRERSAAPRTTSPLGAAAATAAVFLVVTLTWIPFRAADLTVMRQIASALFRIDGTRHLTSPSMLLCYGAIASTLVWQFLQRDKSLELRFGKLPAVIQAVVLSACLVAMFLCSGGDERAFIYFQF